MEMAFTSRCVDIYTHTLTGPIQLIFLAIKYDTFLVQIFQAVTNCGKESWALVSSNTYSEMKLDVANHLISLLNLIKLVRIIYSWV